MKAVAPGHHPWLRASRALLLEHLLLQHPQAALQRVAEARLLFEHRLLDEALALAELGVDVPHLIDDVARHPMEKRLADADEPTVIDGPPHDSTEHILASGLVR